MNQVASKLKAAVDTHIEKCSPGRKLEAELEMRIVVELVRSAIRSGYSVTVFDGEEKALRKSVDLVAIIEAVFSTDEDTLFLHKPLTDKACGWIKLIWGNGADILSDYSANDGTEKVIKSANELASKYQ